MAQTIRDLMTEQVVCLDAGATASEAAKKMRDSDIGNVLVTRDGSLIGIVTDRDLVLRGIAEGKDPDELTLGDLATSDLVTVTGDESVDDVISLIREKNIRRVPVVEGDKPVGIVSLGDLARERDSDSALADISSAAPNN